MPCLSRPELNRLAVPCQDSKLLSRPKPPNLSPPCRFASGLASTATSNTTLIHLNHRNRPTRSFPVLPHHSEPKAQKPPHPTTRYPSLPVRNRLTISLSYPTTPSLKKRNRHALTAPLLSAIAPSAIANRHAAPVHAHPRLSNTAMPHRIRPNRTHPNSASPTETAHPHLASKFLSAPEQPDVSSPNQTLPDQYRHNSHLPHQICPDHI